jgi:glucose-6-phosphate 1-epimerase
MSTNLGQQMQQLYNQFGELSGITIELHKALLAVRVENAQASATVFLQGAQLSQYQRRGEAPIIWCSEQADYKQGQSLRGGIPICWPWFGDLNFNPDAVKQQVAVSAADSVPAHGIVRNRPWELQAIDIIDDNTTRLTLTLRLEKDQEPLWPHASDLKLIINIADQLNVQFEVHNRSNQTIAFSSALHTYFQVQAIDQVRIEGLDQLNYIDCLNDWSEHQQAGTITIDGEVDRIYRNTQQPITIHDGNSRIIYVRSSGSNSTVVWNPWIEKAKRLSHFADNAYQQMLCIETANAEQDFIELAAGEKHQLGLTIGIVQ